MKKDVPLYDVPHIESIQDMLIQSCRKYEHKTALEDLNPTPIHNISYNTLLKHVLKFGTALKKLGLRERSHVAIISENRVQWGITYLTAMCFNYVVVPIDKNLSINEVLNIIHESDASAIVFSEAFETMLRERRQSMKKLKKYISMDLTTETDEIYSMMELIQNSPGCDVDKLPKISPDELAVIIFTSGTLGRAKGVMLSQGNLASNLISMVSMFFIEPKDRFLSVLPIHHTYECTCGFLCPLYSGASVSYARSLKTIVDDLQQVKATMLLAVPLLYDKMFKRICKAIQESPVKSTIVPPMIKAGNILEMFGWKNFRKLVFKEIHHKFGGSIRCFIAGGAAPDPLVAKGLREFGFNFVQGYGLTETSPIVTLNRLSNFKDDAAGLPLPRVQVRINAPDAEGIGEVWVKGPSVMLGYYNNEEATRATFENGWFKTGDLGRFDADGFLHICGRKKNVIISKSGKNVFPEEIEDILNRSPYIMESLVYGEKDEKHLEIIAAKIVVDAEAFIELSESRSIPITHDLLKSVIGQEIQKVNKEFPLYKQIRKFGIRDQEFQKTTTQKIKRHLAQT
jgi:long-chain acyl-CoA synthetase